MFSIYAIVEVAVIITLTSTIGFGWTVLALLATFVIGLALAGSQVKRHIRRLRFGLTASTVQGAASDSLLIAVGTVLVVIPGLASSVAGALLLLGPTRAAARPLVTAMAARRMPRVAAAARTGRAAASTGAGAGWGYDGAGRGDYIDGEVIDVNLVDVDLVDGQPRAVERKELP
ncbi:MAG: membrane protein FxsA [Mycobacterium sp.]